MPELSCSTQLDASTGSHGMHHEDAESEGIVNLVETSAREPSQENCPVTDSLVLHSEHASPDHEPDHQDNMNSISDRCDVRKQLHCDVLDQVNSLEPHHLLHSASYEAFGVCCNNEHVSLSSLSIAHVKHRCRGHKRKPQHSIWMLKRYIHLAGIC